MNKCNNGVGNMQNSRLNREIFFTITKVENYKEIQISNLLKYDKDNN